MRMDERLMQVLRAANGMLAAAPAAARQRLAVRPFAITPLGPRLGLLQWVDDTVPLFHVRLIPPPGPLSQPSEVVSDRTQTSITTHATAVAAAVADC